MCEPPCHAKHTQTNFRWKRHKIKYFWKLFLWQNCFFLLEPESNKSLTKTHSCVVVAMSEANKNRFTSTTDNEMPRKSYFSNVLQRGRFSCDFEYIRIDPQPSSFSSMRVVVGKDTIACRTCLWQRRPEGKTKESFRCNTCELCARFDVRSQIATFYVATQLAMEHFPWHSHNSPKDREMKLLRESDVSSIIFAKLCL